MSTEIEALNRRFGAAGASVVAGEGGLAKVVISTPEAAGEIYLHGGHVTSWKPAAKDEVLYLSPNAQFQDGRAIRGGIPVCFPWFGDKADNSAAPAHGFVRTKPWQLDAVEGAGHDVAIKMSTQSDSSTRRWWPFDFRLVCCATFGAVLKLELSVINAGASEFTFEEALHAYFAVQDAQSAAVHGLGEVRYLDKTKNFEEKTQEGDVRFAAETDSVYLDTTGPLQLLDPAGKRTITVEKTKSASTVVWNPWSEKSVALKDLGPGEWKRFVCVETANVGSSAVRLAPNQTHSMTMQVRVTS